MSYPYRTGILALSIVAVVAASASPANASHRSWIMKNPGGQCVFNTPFGDSNDGYGTTIQNFANGNRSVSCPVTLASRWGTRTGGSWGVTRGADAWAAIVYSFTALDPSGTTSCFASTRATNNDAASGSQFFGKTVTVTGTTGLKTIVLASGGSWGAGTSLEGNDTLTARGLVFTCSLPKFGSSIEGYKVKLCQHNHNCYLPEPGANGENTSGPSQGSQVVTTSATECWADASSPDAYRVTVGMANGSSFDSQLVHCPIVPPADDTVEVSNRQVVGATAIFSGDSNQTCALHWSHRSPSFETDSSAPFQVTNAAFPQERGLLGPVQIGLDISMVVDCWIPPQVTLKGLINTVSISPVSAAD